MENFYWSTDYYLGTNTDNMCDFIDNHMADHCGVDFEVVHDEGTYVEIQNDAGDLWGVHASGNGDSYNHIVIFKWLP